MALWGNKDFFSNLTRTVTVDYANKIITGSGTTFVTAGISTGDVISIGVGNTFGEAVISGVTSATQISIASTQFLSGAAISGIAYTVSQKPIYTLHDSNYSSTEIYGVDAAEAGLAATTNYAVTHAGWVAFQDTYTDSNGRTRYKHEVLVAASADYNGFGGISTAFDAEDDAKFPE